MLLRAGQSPFEPRLVTVPDGLQTGREPHLKQQVGSRLKSLPPDTWIESGQTSILQKASSSPERRTLDSTLSERYAVHCSLTAVVRRSALSLWVARLDRKRRWDAVRAWKDRAVAPCYCAVLLTPGLSMGVQAVGRAGMLWGVTIWIGDRTDSIGPSMAP